MCVAVEVVTVGADFDGSKVAEGKKLISQTTALREKQRIRERACVCVFKRARSV